MNMPIRASDGAPARSALATEVERRRTFAIISHPDAGKTTLTEHLLRAGGAIQLAGNVRAKGERRRTRSDWMSIERERWERAEQEGWYGGAGQEYFDEMDKIIKRRRTGAMANMPRVGGVRLENKTDQVEDLATWE